MNSSSQVTHLTTVRIESHRSPDTGDRASSTLAILEGWKADRVDGWPEWLVIGL